MADKKILFTVCAAERGSHTFKHVGQVLTRDGAMWAAERFLDENEDVSADRLLLAKKGGHCFLFKVGTRPTTRWARADNGDSP